MQVKKVEEECQRCRGVGYVIYEKEGQKNRCSMPSLWRSQKKQKRHMKGKIKFNPNPKYLLCLARSITVSYFLELIDNLHFEKSLKFNLYRLLSQG